MSVLLLLVMLLPVPVGAAPLPPSNLIATVTGPTDNQVTLTWSDNSFDETGFIIERGSFPTVGATFTRPANTVTFVDITVVPGTTYDYRVMSVDATGNSVPSNIAAVTVPGGTPGGGTPGSPHVVSLVTPPGSPEQIQSGAPSIIPTDAGMIRSPASKAERP